MEAAAAQGVVGLVDLEFSGGVADWAERWAEGATCCGSGTPATPTASTTCSPAACARATRSAATRA